MIKPHVMLIIAQIIGATAADARSLLPPGKAAARAEPLRADTGCAAFGPGFRKIEGSDTCVRLGGSVRIEAGVTTGGASLFPGSR